MFLRWNFKLSRFFSPSTLSDLRVLAGLLVLACHSPLSASDDSLLNRVSQLEERYINLSKSYFHTQTSLHKSIENTDELYSIINQYILNEQPAEAVHLIYRNIRTIENNLEHESFFTYIKLLLNENEITLAYTLFKTITDNGDSFQIATFKFLLAKYHAERFNWKEVNQLLNNVADNLSKDNYTYALLLKGTALQHLKRHRDAESFYNKIPLTSNYYRHAQLNVSIAQIRQG